MSIDVKVRKFLTTDSEDTAFIQYGFEVEDGEGKSYPNAYIKFNDGSSDSLYFDVSFNERANTKKDVGRIRNLANTLLEFCDLVEDNQSAALKAAAG